jgi:hypothetical protein
MITIIQTFKQVGLLTTALTLALAANFAYGQWANPTQVPTGGNALAPVNVSGNPQTKGGTLTAWDLGAGTITATGPTSAAVISEYKMQSNLYCNLAGGECFAPADVGSSLGGGSMNLVDIAFAQLGLVPAVDFPASYVCGGKAYYLEYVGEDGFVQYRPQGSGLQWWSINGSNSSGGYYCTPGMIPSTSITQLCALGACQF